MVFTECIIIVSMSDCKSGSIWIMDEEVWIFQTCNL